MEKRHWILNVVRARWLPTWALFLIILWRWASGLDQWIEYVVQTMKPLLDIEANVDNSNSSSS